MGRFIGWDIRHPAVWSATMGTYVGLAAFGFSQSWPLSLMLGAFGGVVLWGLWRKHGPGARWHMRRIERYAKRL